MDGDRDMNRGMGDKDRDGGTGIGIGTGGLWTHLRSFPIGRMHSDHSGFHTSLGISPLDPNLSRKEMGRMDLNGVEDGTWQFRIP